MLNKNLFLQKHALLYSIRIYFVLESLRYGRNLVANKAAIDFGTRPMPCGYVSLFQRFVSFLSPIDMTIWCMITLPCHTLAAQRKADVLVATAI